MTPAYFDHNATTPLSSAARQAWLETADRYWHNPSSLYPPAGAARRRLEDAREQLAELLGGGDSEEVVFTSGATEANNGALASIASLAPDAHCAVAAFEHPSVLAPARRHFAGRLVENGTTREGEIDLPQLETALAGGGVGSVAVMAANNETGALQPVGQISELCRRHGALYHCDAAQLIGRGPAPRDVDVLVGSAHKFGGPKGVGFVRFGERARHLTLQAGGPQENRRRGGTEDLPGIVAMVAALAEGVDWASQAGARDRFEQNIAGRIPGTEVVAAGAPRLPNTSMLIVPAGRNLKWLTRLGRNGVAVSTGSACSSGAESGSHVLAAMGYGRTRWRRRRRFCRAG